MAASRKSAKERPGTGRATGGAHGRPNRLPVPALVDIAQQVRSWTDSVLGVAGAAADVTLGAAKLMLPKPGQRAALEEPAPYSGGCGKPRD